MTIRLLALLIVLVLPLTSGTAERQRLEDRVVEHRLANGLTVLIVERHQSPVVSINMTFDVGGLNEQTGQTGIAHLYEHMAFKGTPTLGTKDYARERPLLDETQRLQHEIESLRAQLRVRGEDEASSAELAKLRGAFKEAQDRAGEWVVGNEMAQLYQRHGAVGLNASTGKDVTRYTVSLPANRLPLWAAIESDRMQHPVLREFFKERAVVLEERRLRTEDSPIGLLYETFAAAAYQAHPYGFPTIGWASDIASLTPEATEAFFKTYYGPGNAAVAIVGDVNARDTIALIERTFGTITNPGATPSVVT